MCHLGTIVMTQSFHTARRIHESLETDYDIVPNESNNTALANVDGDKRTRRRLYSQSIDMGSMITNAQLSQKTVKQQSRHENKLTYTGTGSIENIVRLAAEHRGEGAYTLRRSIESAVFDDAAQVHHIKIILEPTGKSCPVEAGAVLEKRSGEDGRTAVMIVSSSGVRYIYHSIVIVSEHLNSADIPYDQTPSR